MAECRPRSPGATPRQGFGTVTARRADHESARLELDEAEERLAQIELVCQLRRLAATPSEYPSAAELLHLIISQKPTVVGAWMRATNTTDPLDVIDKVRRALIAANRVPQAQELAIKALALPVGDYAAAIALAQRFVTLKEAR